jgi:seryl-tRNA synthetase
MTPRGDAEAVSLMEKYEELREKYRRLEKEHKNLQVEHSRLLFDMDAVIENEVKIRCKMLKAELKEVQKDLEHRDSFFSIMRDVLANEEIDNTQLAAILYTVVHEEC